MSIYGRIYSSLCAAGVNRKDEWESEFSELHRHHVVPKHSGGLDEDSNYTYLSVREHIIAHYLLWRMNGNPNDLRSMKMLGAKLTVHQRQIVGRWCRDNRVGFFSDAYESQKTVWRRNGAETQMRDQIGIHNPETFKEYASIGGIASAKVNPSWLYWCSPEGRKIRSQMGGKALHGRKCMFMPGASTFKRVKLSEVEEHLKMGYTFGSPFKPNLGKKRKNTKGIPCIFNGVRYDSIKAACAATGLNYPQMRKTLTGP